jgi:hypothetical protein
MFEDISEIAENCAYLKATAGPRPNTKLFKSLPPYAELAALEVRQPDRENAKDLETNMSKKLRITIESPVSVLAYSRVYFLGLIFIRRESNFS